jgi:hypothetical protein
VSPGLRTLVDKTTYIGVEGESYDPYKREPQYAHAQSCALWELVRITPLFSFPVNLLNNIIIGSCECG